MVSFAEFCNIFISLSNYHHTTWESKCDTLLHHPPTRGDNTVSVAQGGTATPDATKQLLPPDRVFKRIIYIIIIMSRYQHGYSWPSLATPPYRPLLPTGPQGYIPYRHRAAICMFELVVLPLHVRLKGSTGVHHLWARPYFSSSVPHAWFV